MLGKIARKIRELFSKLFRVLALAGGLVALIVVLDALLSPDRAGQERP
jgi:hypothetical protein